jgi:hypothetical protein
MAVVVDKREHIEYGQTITMWGIFDAHVDDRFSNLKLLRRDIDEIKADPNSRVIIGGDFNNAVFWRDPRYTSDTLRNRFKEDQNVLKKIVEWNCEILDPIKDKIAAYLSGNHEQNYTDRHLSDMAADTAAALGVPYMNYCGMLSHYWETPGGSVKRTDGWLHHGAGGDAPITGGAISLHRTFADFQCDWHMSGHIHKRTKRELGRIGRKGGFGNGRLSYRPCVLCVAAPYVPNYTNESTARFSERSRHQPTPMGVSKLRFTFRRHAKDGLDVEIE